MVASGYKIHFSKSEAFPLGGLRHTNLSPRLVCPFQMVTTGLYIRLYQLALQLRYIADWISNNNESTWLDLESSQVGYPLCGLLFASEQKRLKLLYVTT